MKLNIEKFKEIMPCPSQHEINKGISFVCLDLNCDQEVNQLICFDCMINLHRNHLQYCIHLDFIEKVLENSISILRDIVQKIYPDENNLQKGEITFNKFFKKKFFLLNYVKREFHLSIPNILQFINEITFAFNILKLSKQFIFGFHLLNDKIIISNKLEKIIKDYQLIYLEESIAKAKLLQSHQFYKEAISVCDYLLEINCTNQTFMLKGYCLHMLDQLQEALEFYEIAFEQNNIEQITQIVFLMECYKNSKLKNFEINYQLIRQDVLDTFIAKKLVILKKYQQAMLLLNICIQNDSQNYIALTFKGYCLFYLEQYQEANQCCEQALKIYSNYYAALILLFKLRQRENKEKQVLKLLEKKFSSQDLKFIKNNYYFFQEYEADYPILNKKISLIREQLINNKEQDSEMKEPNPENNSENLNSLLNKGMKLLSLLQWNEAIEVFEEGIAQDLENEQFWKYKIISQFMKQDLQEVQESITTYLTLNPNSKQIKILINQLKWFEFIIVGKSNFNTSWIQNAKFENVDYLYQQGLGLLLYGKYSIGLMVYKKVNELDPNYEEAELKIIYCLIQCNQITEAQQQLDEMLVTKFKDNLQALQLKGIAYYYESKYQEALQIFKQVEEKDPNFVFVNFYQGHCYYKMKQYKKAKEIYYELMSKTTVPSQRLSYTIRYCIYFSKIVKTLYATKFEDADFKNQIQKEYRFFADNLNTSIDCLFFWDCIIQKDFYQQNLDQLSSFYKIQAANKFSQNFATYLFGELLLKNDRAVKAETIFSIMLEKQENQILGLLGMRNTYIHLKDEEKAKYYEVKALQISPEALSPKYYNEQILENIEQFEKRMFIPELYSIQQEVLHQMDFYF